MRRIYKNIVTLGPLGYYYGSGTIASACTLLLVIMFYVLGSNFLNNTLVLFFLTFCAFTLIKTVMPLFCYHDSPHIVIDEVIGMLYTFWGVNLSMKIIMWGFIFFRFFDITKILGIDYLEKNIPNPLSILVDDIAAGLLANCLLRFFSSI